jgi:hypothetical protein
MGPGADRGTVGIAAFADGLVHPFGPESGHQSAS